MFTQDRLLLSDALARYRSHDSLLPPPSARHQRRQIQGETDLRKPGDFVRRMGKIVGFCQQGRAEIEQPVGCTPAPGALRYVISRDHCAVSVYCWNITALSP